MNAPRLQDRVESRQSQIVAADHELLEFEAELCGAFLRAAEHFAVERPMAARAVSLVQLDGGDHAAKGPGARSPELRHEGRREWVVVVPEFFRGLAHPLNRGRRDATAAAQGGGNRGTGKSQEPSERANRGRGRRHSAGLSSKEPGRNTTNLFSRMLIPRFDPLNPQEQPHTLPLLIHTMNHTRKLVPSRLVAALFATAVSVLTLFSTTAAHAQSGTGTITGRVLNAGTGEYLRNAIITVEGTKISTTAEAGGNFTLTGVPAGAAKISAAFAGLDPQVETVVVGAGQTLNRDFSLTNKDYNKDVLKLGQFVVASDREGNAKAIMEQKNSLEAKRVVSTDTFGSISEGNVGEFLKYMPGVVIDYTEADARSVSLGGLDPKYTAVTLDGSPIASSGMAAASGTTANRAFEFEQISINSIESVEIMRTPQPENPGSAMAGIVNLRSKGAFDRAGRQFSFTAGLATNSMSGSPFKKQPGWDDEDHYRIQPNYSFEYSDVFLNHTLGIRAGYNYSYTFSEQKAETVTYAYDNNPSNNATEIPRLTSFSFRDSPKPTIRYNANIRIDYKFSPELWFSARAEYNRYHAKFFSRDLGFNFTTTANSPDPDGAGSAVAGPVVPGVEYSLNSQTATVGNVSINQGGGGTNKYGATGNFGLDAHYKRGAFRLDVGGSYSRSQTWYKDKLFGFFWSINPSSLGNLGLRFNRNGPADPGITITQTSGPDFHNLANYPNGFSATTNDRRGIDQRYLFKADMQYSKNWRVPMLFKWGTQTTEWINNSARPINGFNATRLGADGIAASADENLALWAEPKYRMNFDYGTNIDGIPNVDRWALYKDYQAHPEYWTAPTAGRLLQDRLTQTRDVKEQIDAAYGQGVFKFGTRLTIAPGFRVEHTRGTALGPTDIGDRNTRLIMTGSTTGTVDTASVAYIGTRYGTDRSAATPDYNTWLRYLHTSFLLTENLKLKASYNQAISRPDMNWLIGGLIVTNDDPNDPAPNRATAGNEKLKPELSDTVMLSLEYYSKNIGNMSITGYRRDMKDLLRSFSVTLPPNATYNGELLPSAVSTEPWVISFRDNVDKAHMSSLELSFIRQLDFIPGELGKITVNTNYSHIKYDKYDNFFRPSNVANLSIYIPYRNFSLRWNMNWREGYRVESESTSNGWPKFVPESFTHTLDFNWNIRRNTTFFVNARNVFNQPQGEYRGSSDMRARWVQTGAIWSSGVTTRF
jgi:iron complex outermembrane receptor protein